MLTFPAKKDFLPLDQAVMIKCRYCDLKEICSRRPVKETYENDGWITRCVMTPNRPGKKRKAKKRTTKKD